METQIDYLQKANALIPLNNDGEPKYFDVNSYKKLVNTKPRKEWVRQNPHAQNSSYIPIGIIEDLLAEIFPFWQVEQNGQPQILGNSIVVSVQLKVYNPIINQWQSYAGIGAVPIQLQKGASPLDFDKINPTALHKNVPAALSFAVNNAAKKIGKLFGSGLNRNEEL